MGKKHAHISYVDILQDERFINWQLMHDEESKAVWMEFVNQHPELINEIYLAEAHFKNIKITNDSISDVERMKLANKILNTSVQLKKRQKITLYIRYAAVACVALFVGMSIYFVNKDSDFDKNANLVTGVQLITDDIKLISGDKITSYPSDVHLQIDKNGSVNTNIIKSNKEKLISVVEGTINKLIVPYGKRTTIELADGTKVWLNSGSVLEFPSNFMGKTRNIHLSGEMYIEVAPGEKPFYVHTSNFQVKVYGTKFNVSAYKNDLSKSVVLVQGSVSVMLDNDREMKLKPNDMATLTGSEFKREIVDVNKYISWIDGYLTFDDAPISEVLKLVGRHYNLLFNISDNIDFLNRKCSGKIFLSNNLDDVLNTLCLLSSTTYQRDDHEIYITNKNKQPME